jgi:beta-glucosidase
MKREIVRVLFGAVCVAYLTSWAQIGQITNSGTVVDSLGHPLKNAMVTYENPAKRLNYDFSDANGNFGPAKTTLVSPMVPSITSRSGLEDVTITGSKVRFFINSSQKVTIDLSTVTGRRIATVLSGNFEPGLYTVDLRGAVGLRFADNVYFVKVQANDKSVAKLMVCAGNSIGGSHGTMSRDARPVAAAFAKKMASLDTLRVGKTGYKPLYIAINDTSTSVGTVTLHKYNIEGRIDSVMATLSLANKIIMMTQDNPDAGNPYACGTGLYNAGSAPDANGFNTWNNARMSQGVKIPSISGYDCVHGYIGGAAVQGTMFPHNQAIGCIQDTTLIQMAGRITAIESASRGVYWAFAPCIAVARDEHWGRIYEACGETPDICARVAMNEILGMQGRDLSLNTSIVATAKHFAGDGGTQGGVNAGNTVGPDAVLRAIHLPPYAAAIEAEAGCVMASFSSWNGVGSHANKPLLTDWLKTQQGFDGFVVGDWTAHTFQGGSTRQACVNACISAGLDNPMSPGISAQTEGDITAGNASGAITTDRINDACRRILRVLFRKGMFENYHALSGYDSYFHSQDHRNVARQCVAASMVVLKNGTNTLPLQKTGLSIAVIGNFADNVRWQCGGWTLGWQGADPATVPQGVSLLQALKNQGSNSVNAYTTGDNIPSSADIIIVTAGINPNAEYTKANSELQLQTPSVAYSPGSTTVDNQADQNAYLNIDNLMTKALSAGKSTKKIVLMLFTDGPAVVTQAISQSDAVVCAWLGCPEGDGYADILYGTVHPSGKLNHTWPSTLSQIPINDGNMGDAVGSGGTPLYPLGYGLTY